MGAAAWILALCAGSMLAAEPVKCEVHVSPRAAPAGSVFVFTGSGYKPTELNLQKEGGQPISHVVSVGRSEPWEVTVRSRTGDEGTWTANFTDATTNCTASVSFRVTLSNTDLIDDIYAVTKDAPAPWFLYLAVVVFGFTGGMLIGRLHAWVRA